MGTQRERTASGYVARCDPAQGGIRSSFVNYERARLYTEHESTNRHGIVSGPVHEAFPFGRTSRGTTQLRLYVRAVSSTGRVVPLAEIARDATPPRIKIIFELARASFRGNRRDLRSRSCTAWVAMRAFAWVDREARGRNDDFREVGFPARALARARALLEIFLFRSISLRCVFVARGAFA